jgi:hypothetical protein
MCHSNSVTIDNSKTLKSIPTSEENILDCVSSTNAKGKIFLKDSSKPDGDACHNDGTLKDASELEWLNSPSDIKASTDTFDDYGMDSEILDGLQEEVSNSF